VAQDKRGTVIALVTSSNGTIIAADSRNHPTQGKISDDLCKILTFGNKVAVALGGLAAHTSPLHPARNWDGFEQLGLAYARQSSSTQAFATEWAAEMRTLILRDVSDDPAPITSAAYDWNGSRGGLLSGIFVGSDNFEGLAARLTLIKLGNGYDVLTEYLHHPPHDCDFVCGGIGTEIVDEIKSGITPRARRWHETVSHMDPPGRAIEAIRLTIDNYPKKEDVGGPIDAALISNKGIHWIRHKEVCK